MMDMIGVTVILTVVFWAVVDYRRHKRLRRELATAIESRNEWKYAYQQERDRKVVEEAPKRAPPRRLITRVVLDHYMGAGRWMDSISDYAEFQINAIRFFLRPGPNKRQTLYVKGNAATFHLPSVTLGVWIKLDPIAVGVSDRAQLFRLSDWCGPEFNVEFDLDIKIAGEAP